MSAAGEGRRGIPGPRGIGHVSLAVSDMEAATGFYCAIIGGELMWELGPFDAREMPAGADGRDWTAGHGDVPTPACSSA